MVKLIVEEGGKRRAFRMGKGVLTVGSGAEARLKLTSTDVAEIHLELELSGDGVKLRPRPGVVPPKVGGGPAGAEVVLAPGQVVEVGGARLSVEYEPGDPTPQAAPAPAAPAAAPVVKRSKPGRAASGRASARKGAERQEARSTSQRTPRARSGGGVPAWVVTLGVVAVVGVVLLIWGNHLKKEAQGEDRFVNRIRAARQAAAIGRFEDALAELADVSSVALPPEVEQDVAALEADIRERMEEADAIVENLSGTKYMDTLLKKYEGKYLQGTPDKSKVRLFLKRCRTFRERWPTHPEMGWVARQESRFAGYVDMGAPPTWEDVAWEVKYLTEGSPRNYVQAFALIDELLTRVSGKERTEAEALKEKLIAERPEYAEDRLQQARYEYDRKEDPSKSVWWLVHNIAWLGDEALANESARYLLRMPELEGHLLAYKQNYPDRYEAVMRNDVIRGWAAEAGFKP